jgi:hypothetical protein
MTPRTTESFSKAGALTPNQRRVIAREIVRRVDTVTLATCDEVEDVHLRALAGEFDGIFDEEAEA